MEEKLNNRICKKCKSTRVAIDGNYASTTYFRCETCLHVGDRNDFPKMTNGDIIRAMSDEELAVWGMYDLGTCPTFEKHQTCSKCGECSASEIEQCWLNWLKQ